MRKKESSVHPLIEEGLALAALGMGVVFVFLTLLVFAIYLMSWTLGQSNYPSETPDSRLISSKKKAIIAGAIWQHRKNKTLK